MGRQDKAMGTMVLALLSGAHRPTALGGAAACRHASNRTTMGTVPASGRSFYPQRRPL